MSELTSPPKTEKTKFLDNVKSLRSKFLTLISRTHRREGSAEKPPITETKANTIPSVLNSIIGAISRDIVQAGSGMPSVKSVDQELSKADQERSVRYKYYFGNEVTLDTLFSRAIEEMTVSGKRYKPNEVTQMKARIQKWLNNPLPSDSDDLRIDDIQKKVDVKLGLDAQKKIAFLKYVPPVISPPRFVYSSEPNSSPREVQEGRYKDVPVPQARTERPLPQDASQPKEKYKGSTA